VNQQLEAVDFHISAVVLPLGEIAPKFRLHGRFLG
jgi:hypothetical protein